MKCAILFLIMATNLFAVSPQFHYDGKLTVEELQQKQNQINADFYRRLNRTDKQVKDVVVSTGVIVSETAQKRIWARDVRTEQTGNMTDDDVQGQIFDLDEMKLHRKASAKKYRTVDNTSIYWNDGTTDNAEIHSTGRSQFRGSMIHYSTDTYWTTGDNPTIKVDGYVDIGDTEGEYWSTHTENYNVYPDTTTDWYEHSYVNQNSNIYVSGGKFIVYQKGLGGGSYYQSYSIGRREGWDVSGSSAVKISAKCDYYTPADSYSDYFNFGSKSSDTYSGANPDIGFSISPQTQSHNGSLLFYYKADNYVTLTSSVNTSGTITMSIEISSATINYWANLNGEIYSGTFDNVTNMISGRIAQANRIDFLTLIETQWHYYSEVTYNKSTYDIDDVMDIATISPEINNTEAKRGVKINVGGNDTLFSSEGGVAIYDGGVESYPGVFNHGADGGKLAIYTEDTAGLDFYVGGSTFPVSIEYDGSEVSIGTTARIAGDLYAENAIINSTVTTQAIVLDNVNLTSDNFGLQVSSNMYVNGISSATYFYGDGSHLTNISHTSTATYAFNAGTATYSDNSGLFNGHSNDYFATQIDLSLTAATTGQIYSALQSTGAALSSHTGDSTIHFTQAGISISSTQVSGLEQFLTEETDPIWTADKDNYARTDSSPTWTGNNTFENKVSVSSSVVGDNMFLNVNTTDVDFPSGTGTRLMWIPNKNAFRAGVASGANWDSANIGENSNAIGIETLASGDYSTTIGAHATASGTYSTAIGDSAFASGNDSTAIGDSAFASGSYSMAIGKSTLASGNRSTAMGYDTTASGSYSFAGGIKSRSTAQGSYTISDSEDAYFDNNSTDTFKARFVGGYELTGGTLTVSTITANVINISTTPSAGHATAKEYVDYKDSYKLDESSATATYMNISERDNYLISPATFTYILAETDPVFISSAPATYLNKLNKAADSDKLDGLDSLDFLKKDGSVGLSANWDAGDYQIHASTIRANGAKGLYLTDDGGNGIFVKDGGNVGIGTENPARKLDVAETGSGNVISGITTRNSDAHLNLLITGDSYNTNTGLFTNVLANPAPPDTTVIYTYSAQPFFIGSYQNTAMHFGTNNLVRATILGNGNVGIGTTSPGAKLDVSGNVKTYSAIGAADNVRTGIGHYDTTAQAAGVGGQLVLGYKYTDAGDYTEGAIIKMYKLNATTGDYSSGLKFQVRNTGVNLSTKMVLDPSGNVGIGFTSPSQKLDVNGNVRADSYIEYSKKYEGDALAKIKNIKAEPNKTGEWQPVDHDTLPDGVRHENQYIKRTYKNKKTGEEKDNLDTEEDGNNYDVIETTENFVGRNLGNSVQFNLRAIQQLVEKIEVLEAKIKELEK